MTISSFLSPIAHRAPRNPHQQQQQQQQDTDMLAWSRLPTPIPHDLVSPPSSGTSSPMSASFYAPSSGTSFSIHDAHLPSPGPSPQEQSFPTSESSSSKTAAFFGSPFASAGPPTPAPPPSRSSGFATDTPKPDAAAPRSATADFFASNGTASRPTPPPSLKSSKSSSSSREASPPRLPPLSRFFPSRYRPDPSSADSDPPDLRKAGTDWETSFKREFLHLSEAAGQEAPLSCSPTDDRKFHGPSRHVDGDTPWGASTITPSPLIGSVLHPHANGRAHPHLLQLHSHPIRRETHAEVDEKGSHAIGPGSVLRAGEGSSDVHLTLTRPLGEGAFSSVWLAQDNIGTLLPPQSFPSVAPDGFLKVSDVNPVRVVGMRRKSESWAKKGSDKRMHGIKPTAPAAVGLSFSWKDGASSSSDGEAEEVRSVGERSAEGSVLLDELDGEGASFTALSDERALVEVEEEEEEEQEERGRLVAVKMMNRALCEANDRTRISFVREVEVLRHISHPSIVAYLHSFTTPTHHCLVLEYVGGGELFDLVNSDEQYAKVTEPAVRRMWGELCRAVGWMHGVALVHRDIKLENILLTTNVFATSSPTAVLPPVHIPLIKLSDFGLSRFIDPASPLLSTRCGSESYAAPELVFGASRKSSRSEVDPPSQTGLNGKSKAGYYDGRQTDAWACGVVLYALATRQLPFDTPPPLPPSSAPSRSGSVKSNHSGRSVGAGRASRRRDMLMRIAQCEYYWPDEWEAPVSARFDAEPAALGGIAEADEGAGGELEEELSAAARLASAGLKRVVRRLLVRTPSDRARMVELWDEEWMRGEGAPEPPLCAVETELGQGLANAPNGSEWSREGVLLDGEHIDSVASQESDPM